MKDILKNGLESFGIEFNNETIERFCLYYELLIDYNKKVNLTAITEPKEVAVKHFLDSTSLLSAISIENEAKLIDVGTGAGFPGMALKIVRNDLSVTLADSLNKRVDFLKLCAHELGFEDIECIHTRAEDLAQKDGYRECYDIATARAVANMSTLSEYCLPFVKVGGKFAALKGPLANEEVQSAENAICTLGGGNVCIKLVGMADYDISHCIISVDKIRQTPAKYPRSGNKPLNKPL